MAETQRLAVDLSLKGNFNEGMGKAQKNLRGFNKQAGAATKQTGKFSSSLKSMGKQAKGSILSGVGLGAGLVGFQLLTSAVSKTVSVLSDSVRMAAEEEAAIAQLTRAIKVNDTAWDGNIDAVERLITKRQQLAFSDGEQREGLRLLVSNTKDATKAQELLGTAMDFARLRGISLRTSADLLGRAFQGQFGTLSRYGVILGKGATATEALAAIQKMAQGQASAYAETTAGKLTRAQIALDDAMEDLGRTITPVVADLAGLAADTIPGVVIAAQDAAAKVSGFVDELVKLGRTASEVAGRDLENDLFNALRIGATGGLVIASDKAGDFGFALEDLQRQLQGVQRNLVGVNEDFKTFTGEAERGRNAMATLPKALDATADSTDGLSASYDVLSGISTRTAVALSKANAQLKAFQDIAAEVKDTRDLGTINKAIERQTRLLGEAAVAGKAKDFAAATARIAELEGEKEIRSTARKAVNAAQKDEQAKAGAAKSAERSKRDARQKTRRQAAETNRAFGEFRRRESKDQETVTGKVKRTTAALRALDKVDPNVTVTVSGLGALAGLGGIAAGLRVDDKGSNGIAKFATGTDFVPRTGLAVLHKGEAVVPARENRAAPIFVTPRIEVAASQVEQQTSRVVRTNRTRVNV